MPRDCGSESVLTGNKMSKTEPEASIKVVLCMSYDGYMYILWRDKSCAK